MSSTVVPKRFTMSWHRTAHMRQHPTPHSAQPDARRADAARTSMLSPACTSYSCANLYVVPALRTCDSATRHDRSAPDTASHTPGRRARGSPPASRPR
eukprot:2423034-Rhodomonas_salina.1